MKKIINHEIFGPVLFNTEDQSYEYLGKMFTKDNKTLPYFENALEFIESGISKGVFSVVCASNVQQKRRTFATIIDHVNINLNFHNVEMINGKWEHNNIPGLVLGRCYFILALKDTNSVNEFRILSAMEIKKLN